MGATQGHWGFLEWGRRRAQEAAFSGGFACLGLVLFPSYGLLRPLCPSPSFIHSFIPPANFYLVIQACSGPHDGRKMDKT